MGNVWLKVVLATVAVVAVGAVAVALLKVVLGLFWYLVVGAVVVGGGVYLYRRARRAMGPGTRGGRRLEAVVRTRQLRDR